MSPQEFASYASSACGIIMVLGSMALLWKGIITLSQKSSKEALSIEFKKQIKFSSHYPAIGLFIMGWAFLIVPMVLPDKSGPEKLQIQGTVAVQPPGDVHHVSIRLLGGPWELDPDSDGSLKGIIYPNLDKMRVEITAPGRPPFSKTFVINKDGSIDLGEMKLADPLIKIHALEATTPLGD